MPKANTIITINRLVERAGFRSSGGDGVVHVDTQMKNQTGFADYGFKNSSGAPMCAIKAKKNGVLPLAGKEQARGKSTNV